MSATRQKFVRIQRQRRRILRAGRVLSLATVRGARQSVADGVPSPHSMPTSVQTRMYIRPTAARARIGDGSLQSVGRRGPLFVH